jgi:transposase
MRLSVSKSKNSINFYIIKDYTKNGKRSTKIVKKLGNLETVKKLAGKTDYKDWLKEIVAQYNEKYNKGETIIIEKNSRKQILKEKSFTFDIGYLFLNKLYNSLNIKTICDEIQDKYKFEFDLNEIFSYLIYARIIYPSSKLKTFNQCQSFIQKPEFKLHDEYRALSYIAKDIDFIQEKLFNNSLNVLNRNSRVIYYDCTNYYFEINKEDNLRKYGISKQHQPKPLIGMGLFMDGDGLPLAFNIYPGNKNEQETLIPTENKIINNFKLKETKLILSTDAGLSSDKIKRFNIKDGRAFVITQSLKKLKSKYKEDVFNDNGWRISNDLRNSYNINKINENEGLREKYYNTMFYKIIETETASVKQDLIVTFCFKYLDYQRGIRNKQIERAKKCIELNEPIRKGKNQNDHKRFIGSVSSTDEGEIAENKTLFLNQDVINEEEKYDGYYALTTNLIGDIKEILKIVKGRWEIEESFRIMKHDFLARPVELSREDRIKAHFTICFMALFIYRLLEKQLNNEYTTSEILNCLRKMKVFELKGDGYQPIYERNDLTDDLHEILGFRTDYEINTYKYFEKIFNDLKQ